MGADRVGPHGQVFRDLLFPVLCWGADPSGSWAILRGPGDPGSLMPAPLPSRSVPAPQPAAVFLALRCEVFSHGQNHPFDLRGACQGPLKWPPRVGCRECGWFARPRASWKVELFSGCGCCVPCAFLSLEHWACLPGTEDLCIVQSVLRSSTAPTP